MGVGEGESRSPVSNRNSRKQEERTLREGGTENLTQEMGLKNTNHSTESRSRTNEVIVSIVIKPDIHWLCTLCQALF